MSHATVKYDDRVHQSHARCFYERPASVKVYDPAASQENTPRCNSPSRLPVATPRRDPPSRLPVATPRCDSPSRLPVATERAPSVYYALQHLFKQWNLFIFFCFLLLVQRAPASSL